MAKKNKHDEEKPLIVKGDFNDLLKAAVSGNPKPSEDESSEKEDEQPSDKEKDK
jgi:hypothetical protein